MIASLPVFSPIGHLPLVLVTLREKSDFSAESTKLRLIEITPFRNYKSRDCNPFQSPGQIKLTF